LPHCLVTFLLHLCSSAPVKRPDIVAIDGSFLLHPHHCCFGYKVACSNTVFFRLVGPWIPSRLQYFTEPHPLLLSWQNRLKLNRKWTYNLTLKRVRAKYFCCGKAISNAYSVRVFVAYVIHHATRMCHIVLCGLSCFTIFFHIQSESLARGPKLLSMYTVEQRRFLFRKYWQTGSFKAGQMAFRTEFGERRAPSKFCIQKLVKKLETRGSRSNGCQLLSLGLIEGQSVLKYTPSQSNNSKMLYAKRFKPSTSTLWEKYSRIWRNTLKCASM